MSMKEIVEKNNAEPLYTANKCGQVMKRPIMTLNDNGSASSSMGFPICEVDEYVDPQYETAQHIAELLNKDNAISQINNNMLYEMEKLAQALEDTGHEPPQSYYDAIKKARGE